MKKTLLAILLVLAMPVLWLAAENIPATQPGTQPATQPPVAERLEEARKGRNYLVHHILRKYEWPMMSDEDYIDAVKEIDKIRDLIETVNVEVAQYLSDRSLLNIIVLSINHDSGDIQRVV